MKIKQILTRVYVNDINAAISFYEQLTNDKCSRQFEYKQAELEIASVNNILIIAGSDKALEIYKNTSATFLVDSVIEFREYLLKNGALVIRDIQQVPTGYNMTFKHKDGLIVEYVEHK